MTGTLQQVQEGAKKYVGDVAELNAKMQQEWGEYLKKCREIQNGIEEWEDDIRRKSYIATGLTVVSIILFIAIVVLVFKVYQPIHELNNAITAIDELNNEVESVGEALGILYQSATGESIQSARISYWIGKGKWGNAVAVFLQAYWRVFVEVIAGVGIYLLSRKKDRY